MKTFVPFISQRNKAAGLFSAESLGKVIGPIKPVDMLASKVAIRRRRKMISGVELPEVRRRKEVEKLRRVSAWWKYRKNWISVKVGDRVGKLNPRNRSSGFVEFSDGTCVWVNFNDI